MLQSAGPPAHAKADWVYIFPVAGVELTDAVGHEYRLDRVTLVHPKKLPYIRRRLGLPSRVSDLPRHTRELLAKHDAYAVLRYHGDPEVITKKCLSLVREELSILGLSQLGYGPRLDNARPALEAEHYRPSSIFLRIHATKLQGEVLERSLPGSPDLRLDSSWSDWQQKWFFHKLLKVLRQETPVRRGWRKDLRRASIFLGESQCSNERTHAFLWNMIALELLLTRSGDTFSSALPHRIEAFLGWVGFWTADGYPERIRALYQKRCQLVHAGRRDEITAADVLFADDLLFNLLANITHHIDVFNSKQAIIDFADKVACEHRLGIESRIQPKTLKLVRWHRPERSFDWP